MNKRPPPRYRPGAIAPKAGEYELVDHFGERLNVVTWCNEGDKLPPMAVTGFHPVWFILASEAEEAAQAA